MGAHHKMKNNIEMQIKTMNQDITNMGTAINEKMDARFDELLKEIRRK